MIQAYLVDGVRTPFGRYGGGLAKVRADDLAAHVVRELAGRQPRVEWEDVDDVIFGCANQAGEDSRNVGRMAALLSGLPVEVPGSTINRLCASGLDAVASAAQAIRSGDADLVIAGGVESMTRAPFVFPKSAAPFGRSMEVHDTTIGWRFVNPAMESEFGIDSMPQTAQNLAVEHGIGRLDQDLFALRSQERAARAQTNGRLGVEITPLVLDLDEHPRQTTIEKLSEMRPIEPGWSVTAGNSSGVNDGAVAVLLASPRAVERYGLEPLARVTASAAAGVAPRTMGIGPVPATRKLLTRSGLTLSDIDLLEINEAFAAQTLAVLRELGLPDDADHVNPNGGAIALGHPLGASGTRLALTAAVELKQRAVDRAIVTLCVGVGQGRSMLLEAP